MEKIKPTERKIYFMCYSIFGIGGTVRTTVNLANYLFEQGYDVEIISIKKREQIDLPLNSGIPINGLEEKLGISKFRDFLKFNLSSYPKILFEAVKRSIPSFLIHKDEDLYKKFSLNTDLLILSYIKKIKNDSIIVSTIPSFNFLAKKIKAKKSGIFFIGQEHKFYSEHSESIRVKIRKTYANLDLLTVLTPEAYNEYLDFLPKRMIAIQENGTQIIQKNIKQRKSNTIVSIGRLVEQKGFDRLISAFALISDKHPDWKLEIFGNGNLSNSLKKQISQLSLENKITINPATRDIENVLSTSSIFALTSNFEPFGMVIIEAFSFGLPVIAFDVPFGPKRIITKDCGILVPNDDIHMFSLKISDLIDSPELLNQLSIGARDRVSKRYSIDKIGYNFEKLLQIN